MAAIYTANHLQKNYGGHVALRDVSFSIEPGRLVGLLGPNGAGKSTLMKCSMGLLTPTAGEITIGGVKPGPASKAITSYLPDRMALSTSMRVRDAVAMYADFFADFDRVKARDMLLDLKLDDGQRIGAMSKGMQEKMQLCLVMARAARLYLLDEPLGALDLKLRKDMQIELKRIQQRTGITFIYVTHDQEEALTMSDRVVVMNHGVIQQVGSPTDIYNEPVNAFVADFIGESNIIDGVMLEDCKVEFCGRTFECVDKGFEKNAPVDVVIRPEDLKIVYAGDGLLQGVVESIVFKGVHYEMMVRTQFFTFMVHSTMAESVGKTVGLSVIPFDIHIMHKSAEAEA